MPQTKERGAGARVLSAVALGAGLLTAGAAEAQLQSYRSENYQLIRVDVGFMVPLALGDFKGGGIGAAIEPKFNLSDQLSIGFRMEGDALFAVQTGADGASAALMGQGIYLLKGNYFFGTGTVRPFLGLGMGLYSLASVAGNANGDSSGASIEAGRLFGTAAQAGLNLGGFRLAATYNVLFGKSDVEVAVGEVEALSRNFLGVELGFRIGGRRLDQPRVRPVLPEVNPAVGVDIQIGAPPTTEPTSAPSDEPPSGPSQPLP